MISMQAPRSQRRKAQRLRLVSSGTASSCSGYAFEGCRIRVYPRSEVKGNRSVDLLPEQQRAGEFDHYAGQWHQGGDLGQNVTCLFQQWRRSNAILESPVSSIGVRLRSGAVGAGGQE